MYSSIFEKFNFSKFRPFRLVGIACGTLLLTYFYFITLVTDNFQSPISRIIMQLSDEPVDTVLKQRVFHLDLKGAPPRPEYYYDLFPLLKQLNFTHVLMEYEDMFPYSGNLAMFRAKNCYDETILANILQLAEDNNLEVIPLVQTFGHMEFALKFSQYSLLREVPELLDTICPSDNRSIELIRELITQVWRFHPKSKIIHIGADEAWHIAKDRRCLHRLEAELHNSTDRLKLDHISTVARIAKELKFEKVWAWNDMFDKISTDLMVEYRLGELIVPVVWGYAENVEAPDYFPHGMFERFSKVFDELIFAGAFKGANGPTQSFMQSGKYMANLISYYNLYKSKEEDLSGRLKGVILTGWQRFNHQLPLCELLPVAIPCLVKEALYLHNWTDTKRGGDFFDPAFLEFLKCDKSVNVSEVFKPIEYHNQFFHPPVETLFKYCQFSGVDLLAKVEDLRLIKWKAIVDGRFDDELSGQLKELAKAIQPILSRYYYDETVQEWMTENLKPTLPQQQ